MKFFRKLELIFTALAMLIVVVTVLPIISLLHSLGMYLHMFSLQEILIIPIKNKCEAFLREIEESRLK